MLSRCVKTNSRAIVSEMVRQGLSARQAAQRCGVSLTSMARFMRRDSPVNYETAGKIAKAFGANSVQIH